MKNNVVTTTSALLLLADGALLVTGVFELIVVIESNYFLNLRRKFPG